MDVETYLNQGDKLFIPHVSIDIVIMGFQEGQLKVLLLKVADKWMLPGGHVGREESLEDAAARVLKERTGLTDQYLKLFQVFGDKGRSFADEFQQIFKRLDLPWNKDLWLNARHMSIAYYALVDLEKTHPTGGHLSEAFDWHDLQALPDMWLDHADIAMEALEKVRADITIEQISFNLLPAEFTMPELHRLHERILDKKLERSRFQKKMLALNIFERLPNVKEDAPHRKPYLYRIKAK